MRFGIQSRQLWLVCTVLGLLNLNGCGNSNPGGRIPVSGNVTLDGSPLTSGIIEFTPTTGKIGSGGKIAAGKYRITAERGLPPGEYLVRITSLGEGRSTTDIPQAPGLDPNDIHADVERIHSRFNSKSELLINVPAGSSAFTKDFNVTSR